LFVFSTRFFTLRARHLILSFEVSALRHQPPILPLKTLPPIQAGYVPFQDGQIADRTAVARLGKSLGYLCSGCGVCAEACPTSVAKMVFEPQLGSFIPVKLGQTCGNPCVVCEKACPFLADAPETDALTAGLFGDIAGMQHDGILGHYLEAHVGYSESHRLASASGGLLTWMLERLLAEKEVDGIVCVGPDAQSPTLFSYRICRTVAELRACSGSCYQPVHLADVLKEIKAVAGRYAVVALPCTAKALRMATKLNVKLRRRITFIFGVACGGLTNRHFVDYIAQRFMGAENPVSIRFRAKRPDKQAQHRFVFGFRDAAGQAFEREATFSGGIGRIYQSHHFQLEACHYCDDMFAECADAVFLDAWLPEYEKDWRGDTIVLTRSPRLQEILAQGIRESAITVKPIGPERVKQSQDGGIRGKRGHNSSHVAHAAALGGSPPPFRSEKPTFNSRASAWLERRIRQKAERTWLATRDAKAVDKSVQVTVLLLGLLRKLARKRVPLIGI
jgi:coenzyme F420-reducing hydrogenase beta subunit